MVPLEQPKSCHHNFQSPNDLRARTRLDSVSDWQGVAKSPFLRKLEGASARCGHRLMQQLQTQRPSSRSWFVWRSEHLDFSELLSMMRVSCEGQFLPQSGATHCD